MSKQAKVGAGSQQIGRRCSSPCRRKLAEFGETLNPEIIIDKMSGLCKVLTWRHTKLYSGSDKQRSFLSLKTIALLSTFQGIVRIPN